MVGAYIQLFRKRLREKVHATIPKGIVGGLKLTVLQTNFDRKTREAMDVCLRALKESNKSRFNNMNHIPYYLSGLSLAHIFQQTFSK